MANTPTKNADGSMRMTYSSGDNINYNGANLNGLRYYDMYGGTTDSEYDKFWIALLGEDSYANTYRNMFTNNDSFNINGTEYTFYNAGYANTYNAYDLVAAAIHAGYSYNQIDKALKASGTKWYSDN